jgi:uncharacterized protein YacL
MKLMSGLRAVLAGILGLVIAVVIAALVNLMKPAPDIFWALIPVCLSSLISALVGYFLGARKQTGKSQSAAK